MAKNTITKNTITKNTGTKIAGTKKTVAQNSLLVSEAEVAAAEALSQRRSAELAGAFELFQRVVDLSEADELWPVGANAVYQTKVVLWMMIVQRMSPDMSLEAAVKQLVETRPDLLPDNARVRKGLSSNSGAYSQARSRLPQGAIEWLAGQVAKVFIAMAGFTFSGRQVFTLDGTTVKLAPEPGLRKAFPPASNQYGEGVWPIALLVMCHEVASGAALSPEVAPMYGPNATSETAMIHHHLARLPSDAIVMADAGYGIFSVASAIHTSGRPFLLRMTAVRFRALVKQGTCIESETTDNSKVYDVIWSPSRQEELAHGFSADMAIPLRLHEVRIHETLTIYLVTTLLESSAAVSDLYGLRQNIETDLSGFKVVLDAETNRARSEDTFRKELQGSLISYNLVNQFRKQAADLAKVEPRKLSFKRVWSTFRIFLLNHCHTDFQDWQTAYDKALKTATKDKLPNRPNRSYKRETYPNRTKRQQFPKRKPKTNIPSTKTPR